MQEMGRVGEKSNRIRISQMTLEMLEQVSDVHMQAFKGAMNTRLGRPYIRRFLGWFVRMEKAITLVAIEDTGGKEQVVGYVVGAPSDYGKSMNRDLFWIACGSACLRPWLFLSRQFRGTVKARLTNLFHAQHDQLAKIGLPFPVMSLVGLGVESNLQGKGIGKKLLCSFEKQARDLQVKSLRLSVYPENAAARHVYEKCGWIPCEKPVNQGASISYRRIL